MIASLVTVQGIVRIYVAEVYIAVGTRSATFWHMTSCVSEQHTVSSFRVNHYSI
jgi:hypothetical protein